MIPALLAKEWKDAVLEYIDTVFPIRDDRLRGAWMEFLQDPDMGLFKGVYLKARLPYRTAENPEDNPLKRVRPPFSPFVHQMKAFKRLNSDQPGGPKPTLVTTGTGSGKTESFLYPVVDHCVRMRRQGQPGIKAIILYPMNALAQDQAKRLAELIDTHPETKGVITAGLYVGQGEPGQVRRADVSTRMTRDRLIEDHQVLRKYPPDILLTNYKMLDRLLQRKADASLWAANDPETLQYLVLDEFHAYDGVQLADIACLIRRLLSRLKMEPSSLCPVATSATLGDGSAQAMEELRKLAHTVFGRPFDVDAVVTESRPSLEDFLEPVMDAPLPEAVEEMLPRPQEDAEHYIRRQVKLWFGEELGGRELGERLRSHPWFDLLCRTATARPVSWEELVDGFLREFAGDAEGDREGMERRLHSFLAVVSHAKSDDRRPLLSIQVQLWTREMRGLVRGVGEKPAFRWGNQGDVHVPAEVREEDGGASNGENRKRPYIAPPEQAALPMCVCYACGVSGWISVQNEDDSRLWTDPKEISMVYGRSSHNTTPDEEKRTLRFLFPASCGAPIRGTYSEQYLTVRGAVLEQKPGPDRVKVYVVSPFDTFEKNQCPYCREKDSVLLVSMRRASLSSVLIAHTIGSAHTADRKMLTFVDSVQDSAHLAGFIRHRTQSTLLRTGIRQMLERGYDGATLDRLLREWQPYWRKELGDEGYLKAFVGRDEEEELLAGRFPRDVSKWSEETWEDVQAYVTWRVVKELGLHARLGRSLYLTGSAVLGVSEEKLTEAARLAAESIRETEAFLDRDGRLEKRVRALIQGIVHRMILSGGISHPLLDRFREKGSRHFLTEKMNPLYERSKRYPRFFTDAKVRGDALDSLQAGEDSWIAQYLVRSLETPLLEQSFQLQHVPDKGYIALRLFQAMQKAGLADVRFFGNHHTYGLDPRALEVHKTTTRIQCRECRQELTVPRKDLKRYLEEVPCITYRCQGSYREVPEAERSYYDRVYRESLLEPIVSKEHSGLLSPQDRKEIERRFAHRDAEHPINVLVCTPTMKMGIDIGDLSTVLLSDVPPTIANRVQRVGRAGRSSGTALISQLFRDVPHDQYFWQTPRELLQGRVETPVCRLDAPEVLKRHLRAYLLDSWIRDHPLAEVPPTVSRLLAEAEVKGFPHLWYAYVEQNKERLWQGFESLLSDHLRRDSVDKVKHFFLSGEWKEGIQAVIERRKEEIREAQLHLRRINERLKQPALQGENGENAPERKELSRIRAQARQHYKTLTQENSLEWWTVEGLLPNYTFPDREVVLRRFLPKPGESLETEDFSRSPEMALRDFAPGNSFYARGRVTTVNQIPMISRELEEWRFCPDCHHMERAEGKAAGACPRCGNPAWQDQGQVQPMVRLTRVMSRVRPSEDAAIRDQEEERDRQPTEILTLFEFPDAPLISQAVKGQVFGFEFFESAVMREINFGPKNREQTRRKVANHSVPLKGFTVCTKCGAAAEKTGKGGWAVRHVRGFGCDRNAGRSDVVQQMTALGTNEERVSGAGFEKGIYLYRELKSEVLRVLLPVSDALSKERMATWEAILRLGLREKIGGSERQIGMAPYDEPIRMQNQTMRARYLVLYDKIPGGTGYLRQLAEEGELYDLLVKAHARIRNCSCQHEGRMDGCYRCLFRYESQYDQQYISRRLALEMLEPLLKEPKNWERKEQLRVEEMDARRLLMESDLEALAEKRLIRRLEDRLTHATLSVEEYHRGDRQGVELTWETPFGRAGWRMIRQVTLSDEEKVPFTTRADWVLYPLFEDSRYADMDIKPVVFYCDGAEFHIGEGEFYRLPKDILIREGLRRSGKFAVFNVTWRDLQETESAPYENIASEMDPEDGFIQNLRHVANMVGGAVDPVKMWRASSLDLLVEYLIDPNVNRWVDLAKQIAFAAADIFRGKQHAVPLSAVVEGLEAGMVAEERAIYLPDRKTWSSQDKPLIFREHHFGPGAFLTLLLTTRPKKQQLMDSYIEGLLRLEDTRRSGSEPTVKEHFQSAWHVFYRWFNVLQWLPTFRFVTGESLATQSDEWAFLDQVVPVDGLKAKIQAAAKDAKQSAPEMDLKWAEYVHSTYRSFAVALVKAGVPKPEVGYEFMDGDRIVGEAELAWPDYRLCILRKHQRDDEPAIRKLGWTVWDLSPYENDKGEPVKPQGADWKELWQRALERGM